MCYKKRTKYSRQSTSYVILSHLTSHHLSHTRFVAARPFASVSHSCVCGNGRRISCVNKRSENHHHSQTETTVDCRRHRTSSVCHPQYCLHPQYCVVLLVWPRPHISLINQTNQYNDTLSQQQVQGIVPCCHADPELKIPITIGTVPFFNNRPMPSIQPTILAPYPFLAEPTNIAIGAPVAGLSPPYPTDVITSPPRFAMPMPMPATARTPVPQPMTAPTAPSDACTVEPSAPRYDPMTLYTDCGK